MRAVFQFPASMTSVVDAPRAVSSLANPTRPLCAVKCASIPAAWAGARLWPQPLVLSPPLLKGLFLVWFFV